MDGEQLEIQGLFIEAYFMSDFLKSQLELDCTCYIFRKSIAAMALQMSRNNM